jgi:hypothetical protein
MNVKLYLRDLNQNMVNPAVGNADRRAAAAEK